MIFAGYHHDQLINHCRDSSQPLSKLPPHYFCILKTDWRAYVHELGAIPLVYSPMDDSSKEINNTFGCLTTSNWLVLTYQRRHIHVQVLEHWIDIHRWRTIIFHKHSLTLSNIQRIYITKLSDDYKQIWFINALMHMDILIRDNSKHFNAGSKNLEPQFYWRWFDQELSQNTILCLSKRNNRWEFHYPCIPLRWRHNEHDGVSNHQPHDCLLNRLFGLRSK